MSEERLSPIAVQNILNAFVGSLSRKPKAVVIPDGHCWAGSCEGPCKGHRLETPRTLLSKLMG